MGAHEARRATAATKRLRSAGRLSRRPETVQFCAMGAQYSQRISAGSAEYLGQLLITRTRCKWQCERYPYAPPQPETNLKGYVTLYRSLGFQRIETNARDEVRHTSIIETMTSQWMP